MTSHDFRRGTRVDFDGRTGEPRAAHLQIREGQAAETREVVPGRAFADYNADGVLIGVELLAPCGADVVDRIAPGEPELVHNFFKNKAHRDLVLC